MRDRPEQPLDPLSDILSLMQVESVLSARCEVKGRWSMHFPAYQHLKFGGVLQGMVWLWADKGATPVCIKAGDVYLLTTGQPYRCANAIDLAPIDGRAVFQNHMTPDGVVRYGTAGAPTVVVGGRFAFGDDASRMLLSLLPPLVHIPGASPAAAPLRAVLDLLGFESEASRSGARVVNGALGILVLVQILRAYLASNTFAPSWLGALGDPKIGPVLCRLHEDPAQRWRVSEMAAIAGMSRTAFNERFAATVGQSPLDYLIGWRMALASAALRAGGRSLADIAATVGYRSESAFSTAFKRRHNDSPAHYRAAVRKERSEVL